MPAKVKIYHNPRCSKSRQTLALLRERGYDPEVMLYLETPMTVEELREILKKLKLEARDLIRWKDAKAVGVQPDQDETSLLEAMLENPRMIERPIVVAGRKARLGRPPESVLELFE